ncbi:MAG: hypothetical protein AAF430_16155 [Myxococcota bacterium]
MPGIHTLALLGLAGWGGVHAVRRFHDGPLGPLPGGPLEAGPRVTDPDVDWDFAERTVLAELELESTRVSRTTGILVHEGVLYVPCDLGFIWRRVDPRYRWFLGLVWRLKHWHEDALRDGRVVIRLAGKRFVRQAVRETDPDRLEALCIRSEAMAERFFQAPLADAAADPEAIWFFRLDPRPEAADADG